MQVADLKPNKRNPRKISAEKKAMLSKAIEEFGDLGGIIFNKRTGQLVGGHQRVSVIPKDAAVEIEHKYKKPTRTGTTAEGHIVIKGEKFKYREVDWPLEREETANIAANQHGGNWEDDKLKEIVNDLIKSGVDMDLIGFSQAELEDLLAGTDGSEDTGQSGALVSNFVVPPFSVLDTRQGYWQERKAMWIKKTGNLSASKEKVLTDGKDNLVTTINEGSSNFDPVLAEIMCKWFNIPGGHILDPFGGEQTKGVVAGELGYPYSAVEFRQEQVEINKRATKKFKGIKYVHGDSNNILELLPNKTGYDFCFTSPPYYDLEVYSKADMSSLGTYEEFMRQYENIFSQCYQMLKADTFLAIKVGEIRDKKAGHYRNFVGDNIAMFMRLGFKYYNEFTLISPPGTAQIRAARMMNGGRKIVKLHQNLLVFYKGNPANIKAKYPTIEKPTVGVEEVAPD